MMMVKTMTIATILTIVTIVTIVMMIMVMSERVGCKRKALAACPVVHSAVATERSRLSNETKSVATGEILKQMNKETVNCRPKAFKALIYFAILYFSGSLVGRATPKSLVRRIISTNVAERQQASACKDTNWQR